MTLNIVATEKRARSLARAAQEQAELDVIHDGETQRLVAAALAVGRGAHQIEGANAEMRFGPVPIRAGEPVRQADYKQQM